ncbi:metalloendopeptidase OMA1, mitochondrial [Entomortierella parvispora]|uniref:Metalloendopeptidase OMA1, mitochondrial n=1 Tax=Entomortierella parvispora TaxID=205924 RepID=A0A9P3HFR8_9FUNG|nr:metalloendopeptidase OMA1, mitochondrial [Entomortierella parvispora]
MSFARQAATLSRTAVSLAAQSGLKGRASLTARLFSPACISRTLPTTTTTSARSIHVSSVNARNPPSSSWGDMIPRPQPPSSSNSDSISKIILRPQYKRFGQNNGQGKGGRGMPIFYDRRYQVIGGVVTVGAGGYYVTHLETVPMTGRRRFMDVSKAQEEMMAKEAYNQVMHEYRNQMLPANHAYTQYVKRVAGRIIKAAGMQDLDWEFHVIHSDEKNAFVLPGGKVFVFTGILPIAENENGLATVLGHEIAHQLARHSAEKLSFTKIALFVGAIVAIVFDPSYTSQRVLMELGMMLPFSRKCETEADQIGLQLIAQACFDPRESTKMWTRMSNQEKGLSFAFLNTHPASKDRVVKLEQWMPEAMETWHKSDCATTNAYADMFNKAKLAYW